MIEVYELIEVESCGDTRKVAEGVLGATDIIWKESKQNLNEIPGLTDMVEGFLNDIQSKGMVETVKSIL